MTGEHVEEIGMLQRRATFPARAPPRTGTGNNSCRIPRHSMLFHSPICGRYDTNEVSSSIGIFIGHVVVGTDIDQGESRRNDMITRYLSLKVHNLITSQYAHTTARTDSRVGQGSDVRR
jgi:hypothetical protein